MRIALACWSAGILAGCGGTQQGTSRSDGPTEVAGGETSEFSGGNIAYCPAYASRTPLDIESAELAPWIALAEGHHETTLAWEQTFSSQAIRGFEAHTTLSIDVEVLSARDVVYGAGEDPSREVANCEGTPSRQIELGIELATADGGLVASFPRWFEVQSSEYFPGAGLRLSSTTLNPDDPRYGVDFTGALDLGFSPPPGGALKLLATLFFDEGPLQGWFTPLASMPPPPGGQVIRWWTPLEAYFPDDGCERGKPIDLDATSELLGETPRQAYQRVADVWQSQAIPARWKTSRVGGAAFPPTEVRLRGGEPTKACGTPGGSVDVLAPLTLTTSDGRVQITRPFESDFHAGGGVGTSGYGEWLPAAEFASQMGVSGVDLSGAEYGAVFIRNSASSADGAVQGSLHVDQWRDFKHQATDYPLLEWCVGADCR